MYLEPELFKELDSIPKVRPRSVPTPLPPEPEPGDPISNPAPEFLPIGGSDPMSLAPTKLEPSEPMIMRNREARPGLSEMVGPTFANPVESIKRLAQDPLREAPQVLKDTTQLAALSKMKLVPGLLSAIGLDVGQSIEKGKSVEEALKEETGGGILAALALGPKIGRGIAKGGSTAAKATAKIIPEPIKEAYRSYEKAKDWVWDNVVVVPFKGGDFLGKYHTNARWIPSYEGEGKPLTMKSIADVLQPAVERLPQSLQRTFRNTQAMKANVTRLGEDAARDLEGRGFVATYEFMKGMRGTPSSQLVTTAAKDTLWKVNKSVGDLTQGPFEDVWREKIGKLLNQSLTVPSNVYTGTRPYSFLAQLDAQVPKGANGLYDMPKARSILSKMIEDPHTDPEMRSLATEVWNFGAQFPQQVAEAAKDAAKLHLTAKLLNTRHFSNLAVAQLPKGAKPGEYLQSEWSGFKKGGHALWVKRDVELELRALQDIPKISHSIVNKFFMTPWKTGKIILRPATQIRNDFSNVGLNWLGGLAPWRVDVYKKAFDEMRTNGQHWRDLKKITGQGGTFTMNDVLSQTAGRMWGANMFDRALSGFDKIAEKPRSWFNAQEQFFKMAKYIHNIEKGMTKSDAAWDAMKWTFNYGEVTPATAFMRTNIAPFFTWQTKIFPLFAEAAVKNPIAFTGLITMYNLAQQKAIENVGITDDEWKMIKPRLPEYIKKGLFLMMPWRDDQNRLNMLNMTYMVPGFGDVFDMTSHPLKNLIGNPLLTSAMAISDNKRYSGAPIYYEWESAPTQYAKTMAYIWEQMVPSLVPGGTDWNAMYNAMAPDPYALIGKEPLTFGRPESMTPGQAISGTLGFKSAPVDVAKSMASYEARRKMQRAEMKNQLVKAYRRARSTSEKQSIAEKYSSLLREFESEALD